MSLKSKCDQYDIAVKELFNLLETTEESDDGKKFHPVTISCSRADMQIKLENVLLLLKNTMDERKLYHD